LFGHDGRYGGHAKFIAAGTASLASRLIIAANAILRRQWLKLDLSAGPSLGSRFLGLQVSTCMQRGRVLVKWVIALVA
jgi:hypothetical protein